MLCYGCQLLGVAHARRPSDAVIDARIGHLLQEREKALSPFASMSGAGRGRRFPEEASELRTEFQRDRDRIIHCKAFRRLKHKTQVFIAPLGDHYVTRLTHTLEVGQIARTISRALNLNEDLTEAIALGHDMGHTPFGHVGEDELNELSPAGFRHSQQSLRIVDHLEKEGEGLNLTWEVRQGIVSHSKPRGDILGGGPANGLSLEGQVCRISDAVAYLNHDLADAFRAGVLDSESLPPELVKTLGVRHSERVNTMVVDIVRSSWAASGLDHVDPSTQPVISMGPEVGEAVNTLREFMFDSVYLPEGEREEGRTARRVMRLLYDYYHESPGEIPPEYGAKDGTEDHGPEDQGIVDYISGMTDRYALRIAEKIQPGIAKIFRSRLL